VYILESSISMSEDNISIVRPFIAYRLNTCFSPISHRGKTKS